MSKYLLLPRPVEIETWCTECKEDTKQLVKFIRFVPKTHTIDFLCRCLECKIEFVAQANVKYWVKLITECNRFDEN